MKLVIRHAGEAALAAFIFLSAMLLMQNITYTNSSGVTSKGVVNVIGQEIKLEDTDYDSYADSDITKNYAAAAKPEISYNDDAGIIKAGNTVKLPEYFNVKLEGSTYSAVLVNSFRVMSVKDSAGNDYINEYSETDKTINFRYPGTYTLQLYVYDAQQHECSEEIKIAVEEAS